jgi:hypothetical protein
MSYSFTAHKYKYVHWCPQAKGSLHCTYLHKITNAEQHYVPIPYTEFHPKWTTNADGTDGTETNTFTPLTKMQLSLTQFSRNSQLLNKSPQTFPILNFIQSAYKVQTIQRRFQIHPKVHKAFNTAIFMEFINAWLYCMGLFYINFSKINQMKIKPAANCS